LHDAKIGLDGDDLADEETLSSIRENLPILIEGIRKKGLVFATLDELTGLPAGMPDPETGSRPCSFFQLAKDVLRALFCERANLFRLCVSLGVGVLLGCSPFFGLHTFLGLLVAIKFRLHKLAVLAATNISNPLALPFLIWANVETGWFVLHHESLSLSLRDIEKMDVMGEVVPGFFLAWLVGFPLVAAVISLALCAILVSASAAYSCWARMLKSVRGGGSDQQRV